MAKIKHNHFLDTIDKVLSQSKDQGISHLYSEDDFYTGRTFKINGQDLLNFGTTSYLGLAQDERLIKGAVEAVQKYGTQFPLSKAYISCTLYKEIEDLLFQMYGYPTVITKNSTLAHVGVIPSAVRDEDAVILDHQVHASVQNACQLLKPRGIRVEMITHSYLEMLERRVKELSGRYEAVWYMIDGIYSMYGDYAPIHELMELMEKYPKLHLYVDDVHGMSWAGKNGTGYIMEELAGKLHERMILVGTMSKTFGASGGLVIFPDGELFRKVKTFGGPLAFSAQLEPASLGAAIASAKLHLSDEIYQMQDELRERIQYFNDLLEEMNVPLVEKNLSPVFYIGTGMPATGQRFVQRMMKAGFFLNLGMFPAVPIKNTGVRITISRHNTMEDIKALAEAIEREYPITLAEEQVTINQVRNAFNMKVKEEEETYLPIADTHGLKLRYETSIISFDKENWNSLFKHNGNVEWDALAFLESSFIDNEQKEDNWGFHYFTIRDNKGNPILATFFTDGIWKDDMLAPQEVSRKIEQRRANEPYYLTSRVLAMGSFVTTGSHLFLDQKHPQWKEAFSVLLNELEKLQEKLEVQNILLRDFIGQETELNSYLVERGFLKLDMPETCTIPELTPWTCEDDYINTLSAKARRNIRKEVISKENDFTFEARDTITREELSEYIQLYKNVVEYNREINVFNYPNSFFENMIRSSKWEFLTLSYNHQVVAVVFSYKSSDNCYTPLLIGMDYDYLDQHIYKQMLYQFVKYAKKSDYKSMNLGFSASFEKKKLGADVFATQAYLQAKDNYSLEKIEMMMNGK
ncbi:MAG: aminotransferase class I/II-fold pyridoxal phosphate-dependent enzyme [Cytophagales bacterium]|nr:aminotransferase class I/II-fold pyridoxal phosphate-dependent enzyme [Cytophagales bacterium]